MKKFSITVFFLFVVSVPAHAYMLIHTKVKADGWTFTYMLEHPRKNMTFFIPKNSVAPDIEKARPLAEDLAKKAEKK